MTSQCLVSATQQYNVAWICHILGDNGVLGTPHFTYHRHLTMKHNKYVKKPQSYIIILRKCIMRILKHSKSNLSRITRTYQYNQKTKIGRDIKCIVNVKNIHQVIELRNLSQLVSHFAYT